MRSLSQILGSLPATAFFPALIYFTLKVFNSEEIVVNFLLTTGMVWYLMFNIIGGASKIPGDLIEAGDSLGLKGSLYLKKIFVPCLLPATITGSITAFGGGWNTLIVAEYFKNLGEVHAVYGVGALISKATYENADSLLLTRSMLFMVAFILVLNHFLWQRLYDWAEARFKLEA
jgi:NitT/TauT family transport system permease protein